MPQVIFRSQKTTGGMVPPEEIRTLTTEAQVNQLLAGRDIVVDVASCTEAQLRGVHHYVRAIATGLDTSSIETAISAVI